MPISPLILGQLKGVWSLSGHTHDTNMIWAAYTLAYFTFLRAGEMTVPNNQTFDPSVHLSVADIAVDDAKNPSVLQIKIEQSKMDPFRRGVNLYVGRTGSDLCAVSAMLSYLTAKGMAPGPLFRFADGRTLSRQLFVEAVRGHSFRIGAATTAAAKGIEDLLIKTLGRWESLAYLQDVKTAT